MLNHYTQHSRRRPSTNSPAGGGSRSKRAPLRCERTPYGSERSYVLPSVILMFLNDRLLIGPSLVCNCCVFSFLFFLLFGMQLSLYHQLYRPIHARLLLDFNKVSVSVIKYM